MSTIANPRRWNLANSLLVQQPNRLGRRFFVVCAGMLLMIGGPARAQFAGQRTYCNPVDINYQYNFEQKARNISYRSGADPVIVNHRGEYFLFATISGA